MAETAVLKNEVVELKNKLNEMTQERSRNATTSMHVQPEATPARKSTLVIGDSMIRDIDAEKLDDTSIKCLPGATVKRVHDELRKIAPAQRHSKIVIVAGTNDCVKEDVNSDDVIKDTSELVTTAQGMADEVVISGICPRLDSTKDLDHFAALNAGLQSLCEDKGCQFVDHTLWLTLADGSVNEGFLIGKGPHLSRSGTNRLAKNLGLSTGDGDVTMQRQTTQRHMQRQPTSPQWQRRGCYNCGERNHTTRNCRHGGPVVCTSCGGEGHKSRFCRRR